MITLDRVRELAVDPQVALVGRVKSWLKDPTKIYPVSCTLVVVEDTYYDMLPHMESRFETIAGSREFVNRALKTNAGVTVHLHKLRPKGTKNAQGLEAQGTPNFLQVYSAINEEVRRGNGFRNGAVLLNTDFSDPDLLEFLNYPKSKLPWAKKGVMVTEDMFLPENAEKLQAVADALDRGDIFLTKITCDNKGRRLYTQTCLEIRMHSLSTCNLAHVNLGAISDPTELPTAFNKTMEALIGIWSNIDHSDSPYLDQTKDKQVGLGVIGLANMLAHFGVRYMELVGCMNVLMSYVDEFGVLAGLQMYKEEQVDYQAVRYQITYYLAKAFVESGKLAASYGLERAFTIAPTANCSRAYKDLRGYTCTPEISPPVAHPVTKIAERISNGVVEEYQYPPNVELAHYDVSFDTYYELACLWQRFMDLGGLAHAISFNVWSPGATITPEFLHKWFYGPLISLYYRWSVVVDAADKTSIQVEDAEEWSDFWGGEPETSACGLVNPGDDKQGCSTCGD